MGFDRDPDAEQNCIDDERFTLLSADYRYIWNYLKFHEAIPCDGILADLGISSHQIDDADRGFSTRFDGALDMRMDARASLSAADVVNRYEEAELTRIFQRYGEIRNSKKLAAAIVSARSNKNIRSTHELKEIALQCAPRQQENKYLAQVFQAIRIEVNRELESLEIFLEKGMQTLRPGGRMAVISYHSLEDRLVKNFVRTANFDGDLKKDFYGNPIVEFKSINRKVIVPDQKEIKENSRARSAKLKKAEKL